jgi:uncharacterized protein YuzE
VQIRYDPEADAVYVRLREPEGRVRSKRLDHARIVDYDEGGEVVGVELLFVSAGVHLDGLPEEARIAEAMRSFPQPARSA